MNNLLTDFAYKDGAITLSSTSLHLHKGYQIIFVTKGYVEMQIADKFYKINAPSIALLNAFEKHSLSNASADYCRYVIDLDPLQVENAFDIDLVNMLKLRPADFCHVLSLNELADQVFGDIFYNIFCEREKKQALADIAVVSEITKLLVHIYRKFPEKNALRSNQLALNIRQYIDAHFGENITLASIAKTFFVSTSYLSHLFKEYSGYRVKEYLVHTRLFNAQVMLSHTANSIKNISFLCGYNDTNNFIRQFKSQYKLSPFQYRKSCDSRCAR
ncbi:MAG: AraC family transcriptional regulator [Clostridia bacterium]